VTARRRVAVLMGGRSSEHPISLASARSVIDGLDPERYEVVTLEIDRDGRWSLPSGQVPKRLGSGLDTSPAESATPGPETTAPSAPGGTVPGTLPVPASSGEVAATLAEVDPACAAMLNQDRLREIVDIVPDSWLTERDPGADPGRIREAYARYLSQRLETPRAFVEEAIRVR